MNYNNNMNIQLEEQKKIIKACPVFYHLNKEDKLRPGLLCTSEESLVIYDDLCPDSEDTNTFVYNIKTRYLYEECISMVDEQITKPKKYKKYRRLNLILKNISMSPYFFYKKADKKRVKSFLKSLKRKKVKVIKKGSVNLTLHI